MGRLNLHLRDFAGQAEQAQLLRDFANIIAQAHHLINRRHHAGLGVDLFIGRGQLLSLPGRIDG